jgi:hypothetical protein
LANSPTSARFYALVGTLAEIASETERGARLIRRVCSGKPDEGGRMQPRVLLDGLAMPESPRWHEGRLWFSNWRTRQIVAVDLDGNSEVVGEGPDGLGWGDELAPRRPARRRPFVLGPQPTKDRSCFETILD